MLSDSERSWLRLHLTPGLGRLGLFQLFSHFGSADKALQSGTSSWPQKLGRRRAESFTLLPADDPLFLSAIKRLESCQAQIVSFWDPDYPADLKSIHDPPALLYVCGRLPSAAALAVVGSRKASEAGIDLTTRICYELAELGIVIVSGLARGIDSAAHRAAIEAGGLTIAVLGCGIDRIYPPENRRLFQQIAATGAIISEYPPGTEPLPGHFPGRNRIISGLSKGVLIVEAARKSGSLITADFALEQGRDVFAIPGAVSATNSDGVNSLLKDGAHLVTETRDITDLLWPQSPSAPFTAAKVVCLELSQMEFIVAEQLDNNPLHIDDLSRKSGLTPMELSVILLQLEIRGAVIQLPGMRYVRSHQTVRTAT
ncbi:MAG: DNA-protecting protein DprA [Desulfuromonadales bacterium]|nr:DNA-protecting protein DprA [Desulfuromonadales bacterium]